MTDTHAFDLSYVPEKDRKATRARLRSVVPVRFRRREMTAKQVARTQDNDAITFRCIHCGRDTYWEDGGSGDVLPFGCSDCWKIANDVVEAQV